MSSTTLKSLATDLYTIDAIKFGEFKTKVGLMTPVYCDLRVIISYPAIMVSRRRSTNDNASFAVRRVISYKQEKLSDIIIDRMQLVKPCDTICGVPYTALPMATLVSAATKIPMVMRRKEAKTYGTKRLIEGRIKPDDSCIIIEDVVTSGSSILETVKDLTDVGLRVTDAIVLLDREQGGKKILADRGIVMHDLLTLTQLMRYLQEAGCVSDLIVDEVLTYVRRNQVSVDVLKKADGANRLKLTYRERAEHAKTSVAKKLFDIMTDKETNLCVAADLTSAEAILSLADKVGPYVCVLKTHVDIVEDFSAQFVDGLATLAKRHNFLIMEDRKYADIGNTVSLQHNEGPFKISAWADLVTAHSVCGSGVLDALSRTDGSDGDKGVFLLAETSAAGSLINDAYIEATVAMADDYDKSVAGIVCQSPLFLDRPGLIQLTPGVRLNASGDCLGQRYDTPEDVVIAKGADVAVVGRGVIAAADSCVAAQLYRDLLWKAYLKRISY